MQVVRQNVVWVLLCIIVLCTTCWRCVLVRWSDAIWCEELLKRTRAARKVGCSPDNHELYRESTKGSVLWKLPRNIFYSSWAGYNIFKSTFVLSSLWGGLLKWKYGTKPSYHSNGRCKKGRSEIHCSSVSVSSLRLESIRKIKFFALDRNGGAMMSRWLWAAKECLQLSSCCVMFSRHTDSSLKNFIL